MGLAGKVSVLLVGSHVHLCGTCIFVLSKQESVWLSPAPVETEEYLKNVGWALKLSLRQQLPAFYRLECLGTCCEDLGRLSSHLLVGGLDGTRIMARDTFTVGKGVAFQQAPVAHQSAQLL